MKHEGLARSSLRDSRERGAVGPELQRRAELPEVEDDARQRKRSKTNFTWFESA